MFIENGKPCFQLDSDAGVPAWSPAVQLQEQVGEGEVDLEVETCLSLLSNHPGISGGTLWRDNCQLIGLSLIVLARQAQKNRN